MPTPPKLKKSVVEHAARVPLRMNGPIQHKYICTANLYAVLVAIMSQSDADIASIVRC